MMKLLDFDEAFDDAQALVADLDSQRNADGLHFLDESDIPRLAEAIVQLADSTDSTQQLLDEVVEYLQDRGDELFRGN